MKKIESFGIVAFKKSQKVTDVLSRILLWSRENMIPVFFHPCIAGQISADAPISASEEEFLNQSEVVVSVGGDGTFLSVAHMCRFTEKPIIGLNVGGLGFLTDISPEDLGNTLLKIHRGEYNTMSRMVLEASVMRNGEQIQVFHALNDIFLNRINTPKITSISAWHGSDFITEFYADGIIVATPNGSTAYSLSAGGPIVEPYVKAFLLTPICPHSLTERPLILSSDKSIRLVVNDKNPDLLLSSDGLESIRLQNNDQIIVTYGGKSANLIQLTELSYFALLRRKLDWGRGYKNRNSCYDS